MGKYSIYKCVYLHLMVLLFVFVSTDRAYSALLLPVDDAYTRVAAPDTKFGNLDDNIIFLERIIVDSESISSAEAHFKYDLSVIPANQIITSATILLDPFTFTGSPEISLFEMGDNWDESTITYNNRPTFTQADKLGEKPFSESIFDAFDVTAAAQANYLTDGFISLTAVISGPLQTASSVSMYSQNIFSGNNNFTPIYLNVEYQEIPEPATLSILLLGGVISFRKKIRSPHF